MLEKAELLRLIAEAEGRPIDHIVANAALDSVAPGACVYCGFVCSEIEPDADRGYCEGCDQQGIQSVLVLRGLI